MGADAAGQFEKMQISEISFTPPLRFTSLLQIAYIAGGC